MSSTIKIHAVSFNDTDTSLVNELYLNALKNPFSCSYAAGEVVAMGDGVEGS
ncbi:hypothetical protein EIP91_009687 [Steccherinum ochraceum]|uniref:Uncharacterized protein n=1 Tax=Steccherinum ochraceum TaxID=92696 RepID=A0A4R0RJK1_9APHY|nr:hypothetical protein EIP91_009687 [Steccherinum ochraceum]